MERGVGRWPAAAGQLAAGFINATAANVSHPFDDIMVAVVQLRLEYLQVAHLEARGREWHLGGGQLQLETQPFCHSTLVGFMAHPLPLPQELLNDWCKENSRGDYHVTRAYLRGIRSHPKLTPVVRIKEHYLCTTYPENYR